MTEQATSTQPEPVQGVGFLIAAYVDERGADNALAALKQAKAEGKFYYEDAAVVRRDAEGKVHVSETGDTSPGKAAAIGGVIGGVLGLLGGPAGMAVGASAGAALGAMAGMHDAGFDNENLKKIGGALPAGTSALAVTTSKAFVEGVRAQAPQGDRLSMADDIAAHFQARLTARQDVLMTVVITEKGVAASEIISSPSELSFFGIAASAEGVVAVAGDVTADHAEVMAMTAVPEELPAESASPEAPAKAEQPEDNEKPAEQ
jgi:uncharacterized membrane protein